MSAAFTRYASESPFDVAFLVLGGVDVAVAALAGWEYVRLLLISRECKLHFRGKRWFLALTTLSLLLRAAFFFVSPFLPPPPTMALCVYVLMNHLLEVLFFMGFFMLLLFWIETYTSLSRGTGAGDEPSALPRTARVFFVLFVSHVVLVCVAFAFLFLLWAQESESRLLLLDAINAGWTDLLALALPALFIVYGVKLVRLLRTALVRSSFATKIMAVTAVCSCLWVFRAAVSIWSITQEYNGTGTKGYDVPLAVFVLYFVLPETVGTVLMMWLLHTPRRAAPTSNIQSPVKEGGYQRII